MAGLSKFASRPLAVRWLMAAVAGAGILAVLAIWVHGSLQRREMIEVLNHAAPLVSPPLEVQFRARQPDTQEARALLQPGVDAGFWIVRRSRNADELEVLLTAQGQEYFSGVGGSIIAAVIAGTGTVTSVDQIRDSGTTRELSFNFSWTFVHPATAILGEAAPRGGKQVSGKAVLVREGDSWMVAHWSIPDFDAARERFR